MNAPDTTLPLPRPTLLTRPFWEAAREHRLIVQRCEQCGKFRFYPSAGCDQCASLAFGWVEMSGRAKVYSWIVVRRTVDAAWQRHVPYASGVMELVEQPGLLMPGLLTGIAPERVEAGLDVQVWFEDMSPEIALPRWRPLHAEA
ncbi:MAG: hypothetical protein JWP52_1585 [Rhizobacter sp.]|nr:hypothetical protein [Rhizobacter sp.]